MRLPPSSARPLARWLSVPIHALLVLLLPAAAFTASSPDAAQQPLPAASAKAFGINVSFQVAPSRRDEFVAVLTGSSSIPEAATQFVLGQDVDDEKKFYLHEEYDSRTSNPNVMTTYFDGAVPLLESGAFETFPQASEFDLMHAGHVERVDNVKGAVCLNVELCVKPEVRERFIEVIRNNKEGSDAEPLCRQYSWGEDIYDPNKFHFHEQYEGEEGLLAHFEGEHFKVWEEFASTDPFTRPPRVEKFTVL